MLGSNDESWKKTVLPSDVPLEGQRKTGLTEGRKGVQECFTIPKLRVAITPDGKEIPIEQAY